MPSKSNKPVLVDVVEQTAPGRSLQMNRGAAVASGDLLLFLHVDTRLPEQVDDLLAELLHSAAKEEGAIADTEESEKMSPQGARVQPTWGWFDVSLSNPAWPYRVIARNMNRRARWTSVCTGDQALFVDRQLFETVGGFPAIPLMEDVAISKLLRRETTPLVIGQPAVTSSRRWEVNGVLRTVVLMWWLRLQYFLGVSPSKLLKKYYPALVGKAQ